MLTGLYANNFRCLVEFETKFDSFGVLCGPNGSGKSSVFDVLQLIRSLATGDRMLGGDGPSDVHHLEFCHWLKSTTQEFELHLTLDGRAFEYRVHLEQKADYEQPRIVKESAKWEKNLLFERDLEGVRFWKADGSETGFPLDWRRSALSSIQPKGRLQPIAQLQEAISKLLIVRPNPRSMELESRGEAKRPDISLGNLTSWYRSLSQDQEWTKSLSDSLESVWADFKSFRLEEVGRDAKALCLRFKGGNGDMLLYFHQLSDGEKALIGLYMIRAALATGAARTVFIDEPENFVGLPELQPWVLSLRELLDDERQAILVSHHPEVLSSSGVDNGRYLWRESHTSSTKIGPLNVPAGLSPGEAIARGWVRA